MNDDGTADAERDDWLRAALRHAPDADLDAPAALSRAILQEARAKARDGAPGIVGRRWWPWQWRWSGRLPVAAGALTVMVLATALWRGGLEDAPLDEAPGEARRPAAPAVVPSPPAAAPSTAPLPTIATQPSSPVAEVAPRGRERSSPAAGPTPPAAADALAHQRRTAALPPPAAARQEASEDRAVAAAGPDSATNTGPAPVAAPAPESRRAEARAAAGGTAADPSSKLALADAAPRQFARPPAGPPLAALRRELRDDPGRWTWQADAGPQRPVDDAAVRWLARLDAATASRWAEAGASAPEPAAPSSVQWLRDGQPRWRLRLSATQAVWERADETGAAPPAARGAWSAPLDAGESAALRRTLE